MIYPVCGGTKHQGGGPCRRPAGWGTDHPGQGRCKLHGGATPITHGRYSKITRPRVRDLIAELEGDPDPLNLLPEVQTIRALTIDYIERYDKLTEALLAWHESWLSEGTAPKPRQILDVADAARLLERAAKVVDVIVRHKKEGAITMESFNRVMEQMGATVARHVKDAEILRAIESEWLSIRV